MEGLTSSSSRRQENNTKFHIIFKISRIPIDLSCKIFIGPFTKKIIIEIFFY